MLSSFSTTYFSHSNTLQGGEMANRRIDVHQYREELYRVRQNRAANAARFCDISHYDLVKKAQATMTMKPPTFKTLVSRTVLLLFHFKH